MYLDSSFYEEEVRSDYRVSSKMKKIWAVELELFSEPLGIRDLFHGTMMSISSCSVTII